MLTVGGELGGGVALLRLAALYLLNQLRPDELKFGIRTYVKRGVYNITARGENAAGFMRLLAATASSAGGEYLSDKFNEFVKEARVEVRLDNIRRTKKGHVTADLTISEGGIEIKYNVYIRDRAIELEFQSTNRSRVELAARLLRLVGVDADVKKKGDSDVWYVYVSTDRLAAGRKSSEKPLPKLLGRRSRGAGWMPARSRVGWRSWRGGVC